MTRLALLLLVVLALAGMAYFLLNDGSGPVPELPDSPEPVPDVTESSGAESDSAAHVEPVVPNAPEPVAPAYPWPAPAWRGAMERNLADTRVTLLLKDATGDQVVEGLRGQLPYSVDATELPAEMKTARFELDFSRAPAPDLLRRVEFLLRAKVHLRATGVQILPRGLSPAWEPDEIYLAGLDRAKRILDAGGPKGVPLTKTLPVEFDQVTLRQAIREIENRIGIAIVLDPRATREQRLLRFSLTDQRMTVAQVLDDVTAAVRLTWAREERRIFITREATARTIREEREKARSNARRKVSVAFKDTPLSEVVAEVSRQIGVPVVVDRALWEPEHPRITLRFGPELLGRFLRSLTAKLPARSLIRGEAVYLVPPEPR